MEATIHELHTSLDLLHGNIARIDINQQQLLVQVDLISVRVQDDAKTNADTVHQLTALQDHFDAATPGTVWAHGRTPSPEEDDADLDDIIIAGKATLRPAHVTWTGNSAGASSAQPAATSGGDGLLGGGRPGGVGSADTGGAGGGGLGGAGGGRPGTDSTIKHQRKMSFPCFNGDQPRIWKDKCLDYFRLFNVNPSLWLISCTLHMDGNTALWLKAYRLRHEVSTWTTLMLADEEKFGADDHRRYMKQLLQLKQRDTVEDYQAQFEELSY
jgi:hypothetical protein